MLLQRLQRPQFLLPAWTARSLRSPRQRAPTSSGRAPTGEKQASDPPTLTLFEELFPEEVKESARIPKPRDGDAGSEQPHKNELRREFQWAKSTQFRSASNLNPSITDFKKPSICSDTQQDLAQSVRHHDHEVPERRNASVLVLSNASKSLSLSDFLRLSPKGQHIDGWASGITKVIPGRDPYTLERRGHYFILFSTDVAARAYMDQIIRLHQISQTYTRSSITSPLPPPPGYLKDGEDLHGLMQAFTLIPSSQNSVSIRMLRKPFQPAIQRIIAEGGLPAIAARQSKSENMVLLSLDKGYVGIHELRKAIGRDVKERNLPWNLLAGDDAIAKLDGSKAEDEKATEAEVQQDIEGQKRRRRPPPRFILSFKDNQEARRFVRAWHRRPFPLSHERQNPEDEAPPMVNAELLW